jgi:hypothetical protein
MVGWQIHGLGMNGTTLYRMQIRLTELVINYNLGKRNAKKGKTQQERVEKDTKWLTKRRKIKKANKGEKKTILNKKSHKKREETTKNHASRKE